MTLHTGQFVDATIHAIIPSSKGPSYQVDYGYDHTVLLEPWRLRQPT